MKKQFILFLIAIVLFVFTSNCYSQNWLWAKCENSIGNCKGNSVCTDADGNVFITGGFSFCSTIAFGSITLTNTNVVSYDVFIAKYDAGGNVLWAKSAGGGSLDIGYSIAVDPNGNVFVTGVFESSTITFGAITLVNANANVPTIFIVKYDTNGNVLWAKSAGGTEEAVANSISTDAGGNIYVTGVFGHAIVFGSITLINPNGVNQDIFIAKYDANGNVLWAKSAGGTDVDFGNSISADASGNVFVTGYSNSPSLTFDSTIIHTNANSGWSDLFIAKYDTDGNVLWAKSVGGTSYDVGMSVSADAGGDVFLTGYFNSPTLTFGSSTLTNTGICNFFIAKYDANGNALWAKRAGGTLVDRGYSISADPAGNVFVAGSFESPTITFGSTTLSKPAGSTYPMFIAKYDANGNVLCASALASYVNSSECVNADHFGNAFIVGVYDVSPFIVGTDTLILSGSENVFVAKYCLSPPPAPEGANASVCFNNTASLSAIGIGTLGWYSQANGGTYLAGGATYTTPLLTTTTTYYVQDSTWAASATRTAVLVTVNPLPVVTANASATTVCAGTSVTLTGGGASSYAWTGGVTNGIGFIPSSTTTYAVLGTDSNNCYNTATIIIHVKPLPDITTSLNGTIITSNQNGAAYQWFDCSNNNAIISGQTSPSYTATTNGSYAVIITLNGCTDVSACVNVNIAGIDHIVNNNQFTVFPNPNKGEFTIQSTSEGFYSVIDELGNVIQKLKLNATNNYTTNISNLSNGIYFIVGFNDNQITRQKIVVTK